MAKRIGFTVNQSIKVLKNLRRKQTSLSKEKRILWLMQFHKSKEITREETASKAGISLRTQERWINIYKEKGLEGLLEPKREKKKSKIITKAIHEGLYKRVNSSDSPFLGYWDAVEWVKQEYGVEVKYHWLRQYMIKYFNTKLKSPRKSHYKKDQQAIEAFLKTP